MTHACRLRQAHKVFVSFGADRPVSNRLVTLALDPQQYRVLTRLGRTQLSFERVDQNVEQLNALHQTIETLRPFPEQADLVADVSARIAIEQQPLQITHETFTVDLPWFLDALRPRDYPALVMTLMVEHLHEQGQSRMDCYRKVGKVMRILFPRTRKSHSVTYDTDAVRKQVERFSKDYGVQLRDTLNTVDQLPYLLLDKMTPGDGPNCPMDSQPNGV